jgi:flagellin
MSLSIQTNVNSLVAQENLRVNSNFQSQTIERLTSGYRINHAADDAAGLAVANQYRSSVQELTQGVRNANDGVGQLQIIDGGLNNIGNILDRMKTLATQSASSTFTGDRSTLNNEYQSLISEITRQAANVGLNSGGTNNSVVNVYIGGGGTVQSNSQVAIDLSGSSNTVDATGLGVGGTNLLGAGTDVSNPTNLNTNSTGLLAGNTQVFTLNLAGGTSYNVTVNQGAGAGGVSAAVALQQINAVFSGHGVSASIDTNGDLMFSGSVAFTVQAAAASGGTGLTSALGSANNNSLYNSTGAANFTALSGANTETLQFAIGGASQTIVLNVNNAGTTAAAVATLNNSLSGMGIYAVENAAGTGINFQGPNAFTVTKVDAANNAGVYAATAGSNVAETVNNPATNGTSTGNALSALTAITNAVSTLGRVQGKVGAGQNQLNYAISLAQSQITNFDSAQSQIRDADVAAEAANLTKAQVLQQASIAAMAQANAAPQQVLALLRG